MFPKDETLLISQAVLAMSGFIPMYLIAKNHKFKGASLIFISFMYIFSIAVVSPCFYDPAETDKTPSSSGRAVAKFPAELREEPRVSSLWMSR